MGLSDGAGMARGKTEMGGMNGNASLGIGAAKLALSVSSDYLIGNQVWNQD